MGEIFSTMTKQHFRKKINPGRPIDNQLFLAFDLRHFQYTELYRKIKKWEADNPQYQVLIA